MRTALSTPRRAARLCGWVVGTAVGSVSALGLGEPEVRSALGQPLDVRIPLSLSPDERRSDLEIRLAPAAAYEALGLRAPVGLAGARLSTAEADGQAYVQLTGAQRAQEPFVVLLIEARNGSARVVREVTLLLDLPQDPPATDTARSAPAFAPDPLPTAVLPAQAGAAPVQIETEPLRLPPPLPPRALLAAEAAAPAEDAYGPVTAGETLRSIAERVRPEPRFGIRRVMTALLRANPEAFAGPGARPQPGVLLSVPTPQQMLELSDEIITATVGPRGSAPAARPLEARRAAPDAATEVQSSAAPEPAAAPPQVVTPAAVADPMAWPQPAQSNAPASVRYGRLQLSLQLLPASQHLLAALPEPAAPPPAAATPAPAVGTVAAAVPAPRAPAATAPAEADEGGSGSPWGWWLLPILAALAWRWRQRLPWLKPGAPVATAAEPAEPVAAAAPVPAAPPAAQQASADEEPWSAANDIAVVGPGVVPPLRVVGGRLNATAHSELQQRLMRLSSALKEPGARRQLTLAQAYLDDGDATMAEQLTEELEVSAARRA